jgi:hypothetical protein
MVGLFVLSFDTRPPTRCLRPSSRASDLSADRKSSEDPIENLSTTNVCWKAFQEVVMPNLSGNHIFNRLVLSRKNEKKPSFFIANKIISKMQYK